MQGVLCVVAKRLALGLRYVCDFYILCLDTLIFGVSCHARCEIFGNIGVGFHAMHADVLSFLHCFEALRSSLFWK